MINEKYENSNSGVFDEFINFLKIHKYEFNITTNDIILMKWVIYGHFAYDPSKRNIEIIDNLLNIEKIDNAYYEAQLKYCNFYLKYSGENSDKQKINNIFDNLIKAEYYKASCDYGRFLRDEKKYDEAKIIFKKGSDRSKQFCFSEYIFLKLSTTDINQILIDYNMIYYILKYNCIHICLDKLGKGSFFYAMYYLFKHSSFKHKIKNDFSKYALEIFQNEEKYFQIENNEIIHNIFSKKYIIGSYELLGVMCYYGIRDIIKSDKRKALIFFTKSYKLAKEENNYYEKRYEYLYIYKCRKYLLKNNEISSRKLNKTKEKLFRFYEEYNLDYLEEPFEIYNYYKLSKNVTYF